MHIEQQHLAMIVTALITAVGTFLATKSTNKVTLENENIKNATSLYEQYKELNQQLQQKVDKLENKVEKLQEKYEKEINFYKDKIEQLDGQIDALLSDIKDNSSEFSDWDVFVQAPMKGGG
ncbi:hypothetical protein EfmGK941_09980 [Enterococcus faecium]|uniref:hypothetical protein n=1 Tax=Enterococcus faecium TaxID=1352 RepID=UPI00220D7B10|nr:hypothetical protein [Enterococcus faecium]BDP93993.1 hypothetical protein EfmGK941_09980 [Enterococcus faecium]